MRARLIAIVGALLLLAGCGGRPTPVPSPAPPTWPASPAVAAELADPPAGFAPPPWAPGERTDYTIEDPATGRRVGQATYTIGGEFEAAILSVSATVGDRQERRQIAFDLRTFRPVSERQTVTTPGGTTGLTAEYRAGAATIERPAGDGARRDELALPPGSYAAGQLPVILRALPFAPDYQVALTVVAVQPTAHVLTATITVPGEEVIATPLGPVPCWRVEADLAGEQQILWYGVDAPHALVRHDIGGYVYLLAGR